MNKLIVLLESSKENYERMKELAGSTPALFVDTEGESEGKEYRHISRAVNCFSHSKQTCMIVRFSGRLSVSESVGGDTPEMLVSLSYNKNSTFYTENPEKTFLELKNFMM